MPIAILAEPLAVAPGVESMALLATMMVATGVGAFGAAPDEGSAAAPVSSPLD